MKMIRCPKCEGRGAIEDRFSIGMDLRLARKRKRISLRAVADKLHYTPAYLHDLELGRRAWNADLINKYKKAIA